MTAEDRTVTIHEPVTAEELPTAARVWREYESAVAELANALIGAVQARRVHMAATRKVSECGVVLLSDDQLDEATQAERDAFLESEMADARVEVDRERVQMWRSLLAYLTAHGGAASGEVGSRG